MMLISSFSPVVGRPQEKSKVGRRAKEAIKQQAEQLFRQSQGD